MPIRCPKAASVAETVPSRRPSKETSQRGWNVAVARVAQQADDGIECAGRAGDAHDRQNGASAEPDAEGCEELEVAVQRVDEGHAAGQGSGDEHA